VSIPHGQSGQRMAVTPFAHDLQQQRTVALFKSEQLEVMRLVLLAGKSMPSHKITGELTIQCIEGRLDVEVAGKSTVLQPGQLMFLLGAVPHSVTALGDASALVTLVLKK
jgi:quercetin dioxygenase-like cupin family protein